TTPAPSPPTSSRRRSRRRSCATKPVSQPAGRTSRSRHALDPSVAAPADRRMESLAMVRAGSGNDDLTVDRLRLAVAVHLTRYQGQKAPRPMPGLQGLPRRNPPDSRRVADRTPVSGRCRYSLARLTYGILGGSRGGRAGVRGPGTRALPSPQ